MSVGGVQGPGDGFSSSSSRKIQGGGNAFKLPDIKQQFTRLNKKFDDIKSDYAKKAWALLQSKEFKTLDSSDLDEATRKSLDALKKEIEEMRSDQKH